MSLDQLYCECLMKQYPSNAQGRSKKKPGAVAGAADRIRKFVARGGNAEKKVIYPKWNIYVTVLKFLQRGINKVKMFYNHLCQPCAGALAIISVTFQSLNMYCLGKY